MTGSPSQLLVVMPVFNEQASVSKVVTEWFRELDRCVGEFVLLAIDDGSTDGTLEILKTLQVELGPRLEWISRENRGHGQSCIQGYRIALERHIPFAFQMDSDGQCDPRFFPEFWKQAGRFDVIYGERTREDGWRRVLASILLRRLLWLGFRVDCVDANVPYRLMRTDTCADAIHSIPRDFFLANVALAVVLRKNRTLREGVVPIRFLSRYGGEPSVPFSKFAIKAMELFRQLKRLNS
ncbi:MAG: glycosyltransferase family 2 protein [Verrucomicrobiota bacterium]